MSPASAPRFLTTGPPEQSDPDPLQFSDLLAAREQGDSWLMGGF